MPPLQLSVCGTSSLCTHSLLSPYTCCQPIGSALLCWPQCTVHSKQTESTDHNLALLLGSHTTEMDVSCQYDEQRTLCVFPFSFFHCCAYCGRVPACKPIWQQMPANQCVTASSGFAVFHNPFCFLCFPPLVLTHFLSSDFGSGHPRVFNMLARASHSPARLACSLLSLSSISSICPLLPLPCTRRCPCHSPAVPPLSFWLPVLWTLSHLPFSLPSAYTLKSPSLLCPLFSLLPLSLFSLCFSSPFQFFLPFLVPCFSIHRHFSPSISVFGCRFYVSVSSLMCKQFKHPIYREPYIPAARALCHPPVRSVCWLFSCHVNRTRTQLPIHSGV